MDREALAWAAGFFDGEGNTHLTKQGYIVMKVGQTDDARECLLRFQAAVHGLGRIYGPYSNNGKNQSRRPYHVWEVAKFETAQAVVAMLWPWLSGPKRRQARAALDGNLLTQSRRVPIP